MAKVYLETLFKAVKSEADTDTMICQVEAMKDVIDEVGQGFLNADSVNLLTTQIFEMLADSENRIKENNEMAKREEEDDEEEADDDDLELIKEENKTEADL